LWCIEEGKSHHMYATPVLDPGGRVYAVSGGAVRAFRLEDGALLWETPIALGRNQATPALAEGRLFIATGQGQVQALDAATGQLLWTWEAATDRPLFTPYVRYGKTTLATPVVAGDFVYLGGADGYVYMLDTKTGACVWQYDLGVPLAAAPALSGNGLWVGGCDGWVYAFAGG
jgi:outer membrane protein assembly factor BamB